VMREAFPVRSSRGLDSLFSDMDTQALDLLRRMLAFNPSKRISAAEAMWHPCFLEIRAQE